MTELGAYGLRVIGLDGAKRWMQPQEPDAPTLEITAEEAEPDQRPTVVDEERADVRLVEGARLRATKGERRVVFSVPARPTDADLLHPYLATAAALMWQWDGHEALHAGAVEIGGQAVLVFGDKEAGKSTTLAWLAETEGVPVIADDLVVVREGGALAGPRSLDLRADAAVRGDDRVRDGERRRVTLREARASAPIGGAVVLAWGPPRTTHLGA